MKKSKFLTAIIILFAFLFHCSIFEPEKKFGSLQITLISERQEGTLGKTLVTWSSVQCIVQKGSETIYNGNLTKQGSEFQGEITDLEPANNYSILLYGKNSSSDILAIATQIGITVSAGEQAEVIMAWNSFTPILNSPADVSTINDNTPSFDWSDVSDASAYELVVDNSNSFSSPEIHQTSLISPNYTATSSLSDGTYYWRVRCKDSQDNWGGWSSTFSFTIDTQGPDAPPLVSPSDGSTTTDNTPSFDWSDVSDASVYELVVDNSNSFSSPEIHQTSLTSSNYTATSSLSNGNYYWRVRAKDIAGNWGELVGDVVVNYSGNWNSHGYRRQRLSNNKNWQSMVDGPKPESHALPQWRRHTQRN